VVGPDVRRAEPLALSRLALSARPSASITAVTDVAYRIQQAFKRNAIIEDSQIQVSNTGSAVYLDGTASS
jgi:osmotically-inducible protein OsmY